MARTTALALSFGMWAGGLVMSNEVDPPPAGPTAGNELSTGGTKALYGSY